MRSGNVGVVNVSAGCQRGDRKDGGRMPNLGVAVVRRFERGVVVRLGRVRSTAEPGLRIMVPLADRMPKVSMRTATLPISSQQVITEDNVSIGVGRQGANPCRQMQAVTVDVTGGATGRLSEPVRPDPVPPVPTPAPPGGPEPGPDPGPRPGPLEPDPVPPPRPEPLGPDPVPPPPPGRPGPGPSPGPARQSVLVNPSGPVVRTIHTQRRGARV
jgi:hypothetical protein